METDLRRAAEILGAAERVVLFTGAGVSAESGVPTFRDDLTGLWARYDPAQLATPEAFDRDPDLVWGWYEWRRDRVRRAEPNAAHRAIVAIERAAPTAVLVSQNVDDLHERAGSRDVIHLHGSLSAPRCIGPAGHPAALPDDAQPEAGRRVAPPRCDSCGHLVRPGVVWFGEPLPAAALRAAFDAAENCDVLLTIGTSGVVYPAAEVPQLAARRRAAVIQVNPQPTALDGIASVNLRGPAAQVLPALVARCWPSIA